MAQLFRRKLMNLPGKRLNQQKIIIFIILTLLPVSCNNESKRVFSTKSGIITYSGYLSMTASNNKDLTSDYEVRFYWDDWGQVTANYHRSNGQEDFKIISLNRYGEHFVVYHKREYWPFENVVAKVQVQDIASDAVTQEMMLDLAGQFIKHGWTKRGSQKILGRTCETYWKKEVKKSEGSVKREIVRDREVCVWQGIQLVSKTSSSVPLNEGSVDSNSTLTVNEIQTDGTIDQTIFELPKSFPIKTWEDLSVELDRYHERILEHKSGS